MDADANAGAGGDVVADVDVYMSYTNSCLVSLKDMKPIQGVQIGLYDHPYIEPYVHRC